MYDSAVYPKSVRPDASLCSYRLRLLCCCQTLSRTLLFVTPCTAARQALLSFAVSCSLFKLMSIESVIPSSHLILCLSFLLLPSIFPSIRVFSNESVLCIRWPKCWGLSFSLLQISKFYCVLLIHLYNGTDAT